MFDWSPIVNWKLLRGSHDFPGPEGGTCINEAAIIAAGFEYKKVGSPADCPPCFSPVLSAYLISLNDEMPDSERQKLMRFVLRLSGSADTSDIERQRAELLALRTIQRILPVALRGTGLNEDALRCENVLTLRDAQVAARAAAEAAEAAEAAWEAEAAARAAWEAEAAARAAWEAATRAAERAAATAAAAEIWSVAIEIAEEAFAIGNQAAPADMEIITERMARAKEMAHAQ